VLRPEFVNKFGSVTDPAAYVDALANSAGVTLPAGTRSQLISDLTAGTKTRAQVLRAVTETSEVYSSTTTKLSWLISITVICDATRTSYISIGFTPWIQPATIAR